MPLFQYKAINNKGENVQGGLTAADKAEVLQTLRESGLFTLRINEAMAGKLKGNPYIELFSGVKTKDIAFFCRQFATMLMAGINIIQVLEILFRQTENKKLKKVIGEVYEEVQKGNTFSDALRKHIKIFPELLVNMVETGEVSGTLDVIMDRMAITFEKDSRVQNKVRGALVYPIVLSVVAAFVVIFLLTFVLPTFVGIFEQSSVPLPLPTRILMGAGNVVKNYWYLILPSIGVIVYLVLRWSKSDQGRLEIDKFVLKIPVVGNVVQKVASSRFSRTLSILVSSGTPILQALEVVARVVGNKVIANGILKARDEVTKGIELSTPIRNLGLFPPMIDSMIKIGEESGTLDSVLEKTANFYDDEVEAAIQKLTSMLEPAIIIIMGAVVGFIILSIALPMFDMIQTVQ